jgi:hypothetical protein
VPALQHAQALSAKPLEPLHEFRDRFIVDLCPMPEAIERRNRTLSLCARMIRARGIHSERSA